MTTLYDKLNPYISFGFEQSIYAVLRIRHKNGVDYMIAGSPSNEWQDHGLEFDPVFTL